MKPQCAFRLIPSFYISKMERGIWIYIFSYKFKIPLPWLPVIVGFGPLWGQDEMPYTEWKPRKAIWCPHRQEFI